MSTRNNTFQNLMLGFVIKMPGNISYNLLITNQK